MSILLYHGRHCCTWWCKYIAIASSIFSSIPRVDCNTSGRKRSILLFHLIEKNRLCGRNTVSRGCPRCCVCVSASTSVCANAHTGAAQSSGLQYCRAPLCATTSPCASSTSSSPSEGRMKNFPWALLWAGAQFSRYSHALQSANSIYPAGVHHCVQKKSKKEKTKTHGDAGRAFLLVRVIQKRPRYIFYFDLFFLIRKYGFSSGAGADVAQQCRQNANKQANTQFRRPSHHVDQRAPPQTAPDCVDDEECGTRKGVVSSPALRRHRIVGFIY